jgi:putative membrane protein insertion efficiency factor
MTLKIKMKIIKIISHVPAWILIGLIWIYKYALSPLIPAACRYTPTCSEYGMQAVKKYGFFKGGFLTMKRIGRCHPWGGSGYDPVE